MLRTALTTALGRPGRAAGARALSAAATGAGAGGKGKDATAGEEGGAMFSKLLIANRGEIACRVVRTAARLGVKTVAVHSTADAHAAHVMEADEALLIGPAPAAESYLRGDHLLELAVREAGVQAVHPGYGFLSESVDFARACAANGVRFVGPPVDAIDAMGSKSRSKEIMIAADVPVTPGYHGEDQDPEKLRAEAQAIGYPVMIKAVLGGGGKGMRLVWKEKDFLEALDACRREALKGFNDDRVLLEKFVQNPRHIEFQVFADSFGDAVHLFERDCSVQRRHQKVLEESPAPGLTPELRAEMGAAAVAAAKAVGYEGAGTVEFLMDSVTSEFFFCEMNTRLQVEHPVTEMVTGLDLVEWQLRIAAGQRLPLRQEELEQRGHAIEARVYAENPDRGFLPATGALRFLQQPPSPPGDSYQDAHGNGPVRVDTGVRQGDEVSIYYDPMIAKLIAWAPTRDLALTRMARAIENYRIAGLPTNLRFLRSAVEHPAFRKGSVTTGFLEEHGDEVLANARVSSTPRERALAATLLNLCREQRDSTATSARPWSTTGGSYRNVAPRVVGLRLEDETGADNGGDAASAELDIADALVYSVNDGTFKVELPAASTTVEVSELSMDLDQSTSVAGGENNTYGGGFTGVVDGHRVGGTMYVQDGGVAGGATVDIWVTGHPEGGYHFSFSVPAVDLHHGAGAGSTASVTSPMPGKVIRVLVKPGEAVSEAQPLVIIEAMKMEHVVEAPADAVVGEVLFSEGDLVDEGAALVQMQSDDDEDV